MSKGHKLVEEGGGWVKDNPELFFLVLVLLLLGGLAVMGFKDLVGNGLTGVFAFLTKDALGDKKRAEAVAAAKEEARKEAWAEVMAAREATDGEVGESEEVPGVVDIGSVLDSANERAHARGWTGESESDTPQP